MRTSTVARLSIVCTSLIFISLLSGMVANNVHALKDKDVVGIWLFDEGEGNVAKDSSGNGHDGKLLGDTDWVEGKISKALKVGGGSRVQVPHSDDLSLTTFTIQIWVKLNKVGHGIGATGWQKIVTKGNNYELAVTPDRQIEFCNLTGGVEQCVVSKTAVDSKWHHVAVTYDQKSLRVYIDGALDAERTFNPPDLNQDPVYFGGSAEEPLVDGVLDEVRICSIALMQDEIKESMKGIASSAVEPTGKLATVWGRVKAAYKRTTEIK